MQKTAMASKRSGSTCAENARKKKAYKAHFNPDLVKEWPAIIAKSHKGDTCAFCRLCRCDYSVSSGESKTCSVTSLIVTDADLPTMVKVKGKGSFYIAQNPVRWTAQSALHFLPPLADLFIPTPTRLLQEAF